MSLSISIDNVSVLDESGVWYGELAPNAVQRLGKAEKSIGENSVLLIVDPLFKNAERELRFRLENATVLNIGTTSRAIFLSAGQDKTEETRDNTAASNGASDPSLPSDPKSVMGGDGTKVGRQDAPDARIGNYGQGDQKFLASLKELPLPVQETGHELLTHIRQKYPGDLKPYDQRRFINTPDNFWAVQIQNRNQVLKVSVRGIPDRLPATGLKVWLDRPPVYSAFKIERASQVDDAIQIIDHADRKQF